jgi:hypothetical protein
MKINGTVKMGNVAYSGGSRYRGGTYFNVSGSFYVTGITFNFAGNINSSGSFDFSVSAGFNWNSPQVDLAVVKFQVSASVNASLRIYSSSPYIGFSASGSVSVQGSTLSGVSCWKWDCGRSWSGWSNLGSIGLGVSANPASMWVEYEGRRFSLP